MSRESKQPILPTLVLESPESNEAPIGSVESLLPAEALGATLAKLSLAECLIRLAPRDCNFNDFCSDALLSIMKVIKCEAGSIFEIDQQKQALFFRSSVGQSSDRLGNFSIPLGQGIAGHVAESGQPINVEDTAVNQIHLKTIQDAVGFQTRNLIAVPIVVRGQRFGVLELINRAGELSFSQEDLEITTYFCNLFSKILETRMLIAWGHQQDKSSDQEAA